MLYSTVGMSRSMYQYSLHWVVVAGHIMVSGVLLVHTIVSLHWTLLTYLASHKYTSRLTIHTVRSCMTISVMMDNHDVLTMTDIVVLMTSVACTSTIMCCHHGQHSTCYAVLCCSRQDWERSDHATDNRYSVTMDTMPYGIHYIHGPWHPVVSSR